MNLSLNADGKTGSVDCMLNTVQTFSPEDWYNLSFITLTLDFSISSFENGTTVSSVDELKQKHSKDLKALCLNKMIEENYPSRLGLVDAGGKSCVLGAEKYRNTSGNYDTPYLAYYVCETGEINDVDTPVLPF